MIDHYDILVPAYIESGTPFEVEITARDVSGEIVDDSSTVVTLSSSSTFILFDADGDEIFGEVGDDQQTLLNGVINIMALDTKGTSFTLTATATGGITGNDSVSYNFNCIVFQNETPETSELSTLNHQKWLRRDDELLSYTEATIVSNTLVATDDFADTGYSVVV